MAFYKCIMDAMPKSIHKNIFRRYGYIPKTKVDLINAIREAGLAEEELKRSLANVAKRKGTTLGHNKKPENKSTPRDSKHGTDAGQGKESEKTSPGQKGPKSQGDKASGKDQKSKGRFKNAKDFPKHDVHWKTIKECFEGIEQSNRTQYAEAGYDCNRCGYNGHSVFNCRRKKGRNDEDLPAAPEAIKKTAVSAVSTKGKRKAEEEPEDVPEPKRQEPENPEQINRIWEIDDSSEDEEMTGF